MVNVEYSWKPIRCGYCLLLGHEESKCKSKRIFPSAGKAHRKRAVHRNRSLHIGSTDGLQKEDVVADYFANPFAPFLADCDFEIVKDLEVQCPQAIEQMVADDMEKAPASCSSLAAASLGLVTSVDVDPEQPDEASVVENKTLKEAFREADEPLNYVPSHADCPGHASDLVVNNYPTSIGYQDIQNPLVTGIHMPDFCPQEDISMVVFANPCYYNHKEWHHDSYAKVLRCGIIATGVGSPGAGAAPIPLRPITDADRMDALGILNCPEEVIGSPSLSSSVHAAPSHPQGGDPRQCTNTE
ncbi:hypothetical protein Nepgr_006843 [Nepenthes gracilis]|uniref:Uncharacterized protein n=1 Tax=Nepenthes gracilis TaxID=150966 RepID=A0AAD3S5V6_NEPGR|nr:hypothetical protein Nepgr_006843 [Nepenthes gracilis]